MDPIQQYHELYVAQKQCITKETCSGLIFNRYTEKYTLVTSTAETRFRFNQEFEVWKKPGNPCERMSIYLPCWMIYSRDL